MSEIKQDLVKIVGAENVSDDDFELECYSRNWGLSTVPRKPLIIVKPKSVEQVSEIVRIANQMRIPVTPIGGKSNCIETWPKGSIAVDMTDLNKLIEIDEESMTVTAQAGMTHGALYAEVAKKGWTIGFKHHGFKTATLGGSVALTANCATGPMYGLLGDQIVALQVVLPNSDIIGTGSGANPSAKKFERYCYGSDLTGLFIGSHGIFGIITEVTLKLYPLPEYRANYGFEFDSEEDAVKTTYEIQKTRIPTELMYLRCGKKSLAMSRDRFGLSADAEGIIFPLVLAGTEDEVKFYGKKLEELCSVKGKPIEGMNKKSVDILSGNRRTAGTYKPRSVPFCSNIPTLHVTKCGRAFMKLYEDFEAEKYRIYTAGYGGHCRKGGLITFSAGFSYDTRYPETLQKARELTEKYFELGMSLGLAPHYIGYTRQNVIMWKLGGTYDLLRNIKKALDPNNIMTPGQLLMPNF